MIGETHLLSVVLIAAGAAVSAVGTTVAARRSPGRQPLWRGPDQARGVQSFCRLVGLIVAIFGCSSWASHAFLPVWGIATAALLIIPMSAQYLVQRSRAQPAA